MIPVQLAWCRETSADPDGWTPVRPSHGQCAVTALIVQDFLGGELLRTVNQGVSHYWNRLSDWTEVDITREQFDIWEPGEIVYRDRDYVIGHAETLRRYLLLRHLVMEERMHDSPQAVTYQEAVLDGADPTEGFYE